MMSHLYKWDITTLQARAGVEVTRAYLITSRKKTAIISFYSVCVIILGAPAGGARVV